MSTRPLNAKKANVKVTVAYSIPMFNTLEEKDIISRQMFEKRRPEVSNSYKLPTCRRKNRRQKEIRFLDSCFFPFLPLRPRENSCLSGRFKWPQFMP